MPITKDEWNSGRTGDTLESRIVTFLTNNRSKAYNVSEITAYLYPMQYQSFADIVLDVLNNFNVREALRTLCKEGKVSVKSVKKPIWEQEYYTVP